ncbi:MULTISPECIES: hypothetical protein [Cronobacter]|uniref:hypothetical protein n=1 Tax=Cronobacter TaxID=413496 RepID=UPI0021033E32|nr:MULTISPECIES: hypothetical protein [Cronobacter]MDK1186936.1 hypothetical protein [Cronobacter turicensis]MDK1191338.1 hypothetical protein [Cronobacter dublinensis]MDK1201977.1 hypothetical protein [Cronobacter dublinensis]MDK1207830.1 hypothetical protein [Cronobacter turicensis]MDK1216751.1 hypothetical protein [Cronobacter turicensis]
MLQPGETLSLKAARRRWYESCRNRTVLSRRTRALAGKQRRRLEQLSFDERKRQVAERLYRSLGERAGMVLSQQFEKMVWQQLYQLELVNLDAPAAAPPLPCPPFFDSPLCCGGFPTSVHFHCTKNTRTLWPALPVPAELSRRLQCR